MFKKPLLIELLVSTTLVAVLHKLALMYSLYWTLSWFDIITHSLGGFVIGIMTLFVFFTSGYIKYPKDHWIVVLSVTIGAVLIVGLTWELWELFVGFTDVIKDRGDTVLDLIMDIVGATAAYLYGRNKLIK